MLRVEIHDSEDVLRLKLEGRFTGTNAENTRPLVARCHSRMRLIVDLSEVTFIDSVGEEVLSFFNRFGAEFGAPTSYTLDVCERLHLRLIPYSATTANTSEASPNGHRNRVNHTRRPKNGRP
jgi:hypothetical protein